MRSKIGKLLYGFISFLCTISAVSAFAATSDEGQWAWLVPATGVNMTVQWSNGDSSTSLYLINRLDQSSPYFDSTLLLTNTGYSSATIMFNGGSAHVGNESVDLTNGTYYFAFSYDGGNTLDTTYKWAATQDSPVYQLFSDNGKLTATLFASPSQPSAVPIPGAALLLGSGLLGLVGIGSRKKKSIVPVAA